MKKSVFIVLAVTCLFAAACVKSPSSPSAKDQFFKMEFQNSISPYPGYYGIMNTYIDADASSGTHSANAALLIGRMGAGVAKFRALIKIDVSYLIPENIKVEEAYLTFYSPGCITACNNVTAYKLRSSWCLIANWTKSCSSDWDTPGGYYDGNPVCAAFTDPLYGNYTSLSLDTGMVQEWVTKPDLNYGIIFIGDNEDSTDGALMLLSTEQAIAYDSPRLTIYYSLP